MCKARQAEGNQTSAYPIWRWPIKQGKPSFHLLNNRQVSDLLMNANICSQDHTVYKKKIMNLSWVSLRSISFWGTKCNITCWPQIGYSPAKTFLHYSLYWRLRHFPKKHFISQSLSFMAQAYRKKCKLCWPSCCFLAQGTASSYIFLSLLLVSLTNHRFLSKRKLC